MTLLGNIITPDLAGFGELSFRNGKITAISIKEQLQEDAYWITPGFIDMHIHGSGNYTFEGGEKDIRSIAEFLATKGVTRFLPTQPCAEHAELIEFIKIVKDIVKSPTPGASLVAGSHLEGPYLSLKFCGGMLPSKLRTPNIKETQEYLDVADGTLKLMTIAPELPGALEIVKLLKSNNVIVSLGHSDCPPALFREAVNIGISQVCHLFDAYDAPGIENGIRQAAVTDLALINDKVYKEIIMDGLHVPAELVTLARRSAGADKIIAITDALQGAGLKEGRFYECGKAYIIKEGQLAYREEDGAIIGSSLSMNRAFYNMVKRFDFSPIEAAKASSSNQAKQLGIYNFTGSLEVGKVADITILEPDSLTVHATYLEGKSIFEI